MAIIEIPVRADRPAYSFQIDLEGTKYTLRFRYNERLAGWVMDIATAEEVDLVCGIPVQTNVDLAGRFVTEGLPPGLFLAYDETGAAAEATRDNFGESVKLLYKEAAT